MKFAPIAVFAVLISISCGPAKVKKVEEKQLFTEVEIEYLIEDTTLNVRALEADKNGKVVYATSDGRLGVIYNKNNGNGTQGTVLDQLLPRAIKHDTIVPNFRALAINGRDVFALSIASPALLYRINNKQEYELVYKDKNAKAFYDALDFWNEKEGIAIGDPIDNCLSILITRDWGQNWERIPCERLPEINEGEAAFAASDTNIAIVGDKTWVATGGKSSRILYSPDKGYTWSVIDTPITQGEETTGIYSMAFYDENRGFAIGGDYKKPELNEANKLRTANGGESWYVVATNQDPGYRSCVQYVPESNANGLVAVGFKGVDYTSNAGETWTHLSDESFYTIRFINKNTAFAAGKGVIAKLRFR